MHWVDIPVLIHHRDSKCGLQCFSMLTAFMYRVSLFGSLEPFTTDSTNTSQLVHFSHSPPTIMDAPIVVLTELATPMRKAIKPQIIIIISGRRAHVHVDANYGVV